MANEGSVELDSRHYRDVLGAYPTGVALITAVHPELGPVGLVVGSFTSVSLDPPLVAFLPRAESGTWRQLAAVGRFCVNVLTAGQERLCRAFASQQPDRFERHPWVLSPGGSPLLEECAAWIDCAVEEVHEAGDHLIVVGRVESLDHRARTAMPLVFFRGGYGSFRTSSLLSGDAVVMKELRALDLVRTEFETFAAEREIECVATALVEDHLVTFASAGQAPHRLQPPRRIGHRQLFAAPFGTTFAAHLDEAAIADWMRRGRTALEPEERADFTQLIEDARRTGYGLTLGRDRERELSLLRAHVAAHEDPATVDVSVTGRIAELERAPGKPAPGEPGDDVVAVHVPVVDRDGVLRFGYTATGFGGNLTDAEVGELASGLGQLAELTVQRLGGDGAGSDQNG